MKLTYTEEFPENILEPILKLVPKTPSFLTVEFIDRLREMLVQVGIVCEDRDEIILCLNLFEDLDLIQLQEVQEDNYVTYKIHRKYLDEQ